MRHGGIVEMIEKLGILVMKITAAGVLEVLLPCHSAPSHNMPGST